ncbi:MAG: hypothetical protein QOJ03_3157, partial [Frankiaceae bacterium]|nr:hypothetical protein [Frankiaceae bacterium]
DAADRKYLQEDDVALKLTDGYFVLDFVKHNEFGYPTDPAYDVDRRVDDLLAQGQTETDSARFFAEADQMETSRSKLFAIDVGLVVALALIAIGQVTRRRRNALMWAAPGLVLFVAATVLFVAVEA